MVDIFRENNNINFLDFPLNRFNILNQNPIFGLDNILNDSDSENISKDNSITNQLKNEKQVNKPLLNEDIKVDSCQKDKKKETPLKTKNNFEIKTTNENSDSFKDKQAQLPVQYKYDKINDEIIPKLRLDKEKKKKFIRNKNILDFDKALSDDKFLGKKTRNRDIPKSKEEIKKKRGRKKKNDDPSDSKHNKESQDNIIKKIKSDLFDYLIKSINNLLNSLSQNKKNVFNVYNPIIELNKEKIKKIDYKKFVNNMKKKDNLKLLKTILKNVLSNDISSKYSTKEKDSNKKEIEKLLNQEKNKEIITFVFNLTFGDWLDFFTYKKEINDLDNSDNKIRKEIEDNFERVDKLLEEMCNKNNYEDSYFSLYICLLYNFERWFFIKQERKKKDRSKEEED